MGKELFKHIDEDGEVSWLPWKKESEAIDEDPFMVVKHNETGEIFKINCCDFTASGKEGELKRSLEERVRICDALIYEEVSEKHVDPMLALASEFAKAEDWTIEEVATEPYRPGVVY